MYMLVINMMQSSRVTLFLLPLLFFVLLSPLSGHASDGEKFSGTDER